MGGVGVAALKRRVGAPPERNREVTRVVIRSLLIREVMVTVRHALREEKGLRREGDAAMRAAAMRASESLSEGGPPERDS